MIEAQDFQDECASIATLLHEFPISQYDTPTLFKGWTISDIIGHLHLWNIAADLTLTDPDAFTSFVTKAMGFLANGGTHPELQNTYFEGLNAADIIAQWTQFYPEMSERFASADPDARVLWVGPDMSVRSCIIARQMETWAHAQAIFDVLGQTRVNTDRLKNIAHIGVTTYSWSFKVNGLTPPKPKPYVRLTAPSGKIWEWNTPQDDNVISGDATQFCQVVTQCRNIKDTTLILTGDIAATWMSIAQCFAGPPETPPAKGARHSQNPLNQESL